MDTKIPVLIVEDEVAHADIMAEALEREGYAITIANSGEDGLTKLDQIDPYMVVTDLKLGGSIDGLEIVSAVAERDGLCSVVLITAHSSIETCKTALRDGAFEYIEKPIDLNDLRDVVKRGLERVYLQRENQCLHERLDDKFGFEGVIGHSPTMLKILDKLRRAAKSDIPVLIIGASGVGKELMATAIHNNSPRKNAPFQPVNCAGLSDTLLESELFGHVKGAFTGAMGDRKGFFAMADGGTLFLDEIGDMPMMMQAKLLRILEDQIVVPVGSTQGFKVDVRIVSATNQDLERAVDEKKFRQDLYYRIRGVDISIPPLRSRREDILLLAEHFLAEFSNSEDIMVKGFTGGAQRLLKSYEWPGNVRELRNCVKTMVVLAEKEMLDVTDLPFEMHQSGEGNAELSNLAGMNLNELEKAAIKRTLEMVNGNRETASKMLGIGERTLYRKIKEYGLS